MSDPLKDIVPPYNNFPSQISGPSGEQVYWAATGSVYPVFPDDVDEQLIRELFDKAALAWVDLVSPVYDNEIIEAAFESEKGMEKLKQEAFYEGIPFISLSNIPLDEEYFEDNYHICYFASEPCKINDNTYITVGVIGP